jgi:hypothetical protein
MMTATAELRPFTRADLAHAVALFAAERCQTYTLIPNAPTERSQHRALPPS